MHVLRAQGARDIKDVWLLAELETMMVMMMGTGGGRGGGGGGWGGGGVSHLEFLPHLSLHTYARLATFHSHDQTSWRRRKMGAFTIFFFSFLLILILLFVLLPHGWALS